MAPLSATTTASSPTTASVPADSTNPHCANGDRTLSPLGGHQITAATNADAEPAITAATNTQPNAAACSPPPAPR